MKQLVIIALLTTIWGCGSQSVATSGNNNSAITITKSDTNIYITLAERKLGTLYAGETVEGVLEFVNKNDSTLIIKELKSSCGCMTITESFNKIEPKEIKQLSYSINTQGKSNEEFFDILLITSHGKFIVELSANIK